MKVGIEKTETFRAEHTRPEVQAIVKELGTLPISGESHPVLNTLKEKYEAAIKPQARRGRKPKPAPVNGTPAPAAKAPATAGKK